MSQIRRKDTDLPRPDWKMYLRLAIALVAQLLALALLILFLSPWSVSLPRPFHDWSSVSARVAMQGMVASLQFAVIAESLGRLRSPRWRSRALQTVYQTSALEFIASAGSYILITFGPSMRGSPPLILPIEEIANIIVAAVYVCLFGSFLLIIVGVASLE
jgi:hypothetical protein